MKPWFVLLVLGVLVIGLVSCQSSQETPDPYRIREIRMTFRLETLDFTTEDDRLMLSVIDRGDHLELTVNAVDPFVLDSKLMLYVGNDSIQPSLYSIHSNRLIYRMPHPFPVDPDSNVEVSVTFDPDGGYWGPSVLDDLEPDATLLITSKDDTSGETFSLFDASRLTLRWFYKLFLRHDASSDVYCVVAADASTASVSNLVLPEYDYVIGVHLHTQDTVARDLVRLWTEQFTPPMYVRFGKDPSTYQSGTLSVEVYRNERLTSPMVLNYLNPSELPTPIRETHRFLGWSDGNQTYLTFPGYPARQGIRSITYVALWQGATLVELNTFLQSRIPSFAADHLVLPVSYGGFDITWESSHPEVIDTSGRYKKPYQDTKVTLTATVTSSEENDVLSFDIETKGYKSLSIPIASSYIYRGYASVSDAFFEVLDVINTAFIVAEPDGSLKGNVYLDNVSTYIFPKAREHGNWVIMSVAPESSWSTIARSSALTEVFANNIVDMINLYGFDGVDIDWETPTPSEATLYTSLMRTVYQKVKANNPNHLVTTAITGGMWQPPRYDLLNSLPFIDYINMMTYGMVTSGAQYQNALYPSSAYHHLEFKAGKTLISCSIEESVAIFKDQYAVPLAKIIVGVAFYGIRQTRSYNTSTQTWTSWTFAGSVFYTDIALHYLESSQYIKAFDQKAGVPYLLKTDGTEFISYDNYRSIRDKGSYIITQNLGGMMFWENGTDGTGALLEGVRAGLLK